MVSQNVSRGTDQIALIAGLCVAVVFVAMRTGARWFKTRTIPRDMEDIFMYLAIVSFAITSALYLATVPAFFDVMAISAGEKQPYPGLDHDLVVMLEEFFVVQFFFWLTLWAVKWSLLFMFKRLTNGLPVYTQVWWGVLVFSVLAFIGCCVSNFTSCSSMHAWFNAGECTTPRDSRAKEISLWFSLGADLSTDLLIMAVPIRVLWNLKITVLEKISIGVVFTVGLITMVTAVIRSVTLESSASSGQVSTTWLMLWAAIEAAVAIIVGCLPSFAVFIRGRVAASRADYEGSGSNMNQSDLASGPKSLDRTPHRRSQDFNRFWQFNDTDTGSDKSLVEGRPGNAGRDGGIVVTRTWSQKWQNNGGQSHKMRKDRLGEVEYELETVGP